MNRTATDDVLNFPCDFPIKAMGYATEAFETAVYQIINQHVDELKENSIKTKQSSNGNYMSITITIQATSRQQLDQIYEALTAHQQILVAL